MSSIPAITAAADVPDAVRFAERRPTARWYVVKRAEAVGLAEYLIPESWGLVAGAITDAERENAAKHGEAMKDGSYPTRNREELGKAVKAIGRGEKHSHQAIREYIIKRARALNAVDVLPESWGVTAAGEGVLHGLENAASELGKAWNNALHPRGRDGKFIEKGAKVHVFGDSSTKPSGIGTVVGNADGKIQVKLDPGSAGGVGDTVSIEPGKIATVEPAKAQLPAENATALGAKAYEATQKANEAVSAQDRMNAHSEARAAHAQAAQAHAHEHMAANPGSDELSGRADAHLAMAVHHQEQQHAASMETAKQQHAAAKASVTAHAATEKAYAENTPDAHQSALEAHQNAAGLHSAAGNTEQAAIHQNLSDTHGIQASNLENAGVETPPVDDGGQGPYVGQPGVDHPELVSDWRPGEPDPTNERDYAKAVLSEAKGYQEQNLDPEMMDGPADEASDPQLDSLTNDLENALLGEHPDATAKADELHAYLSANYADGEDLPNKPETLHDGLSGNPQVGPPDNPAQVDQQAPAAPDFSEGGTPTDAGGKLLHAAAASHATKTGGDTTAAHAQMASILNEPDHNKAHAALAKFSTAAKHGGKQRARYRQALNEHRTSRGLPISDEGAKLKAKEAQAAHTDAIRAHPMYAKAAASAKKENNHGLAMRYQDVLHNSSGVNLDKESKDALFQAYHDEIGKRGLKHDSASYGHAIPDNAKIQNTANGFVATDANGQTKTLSSLDQALDFVNAAHPNGSIGRDKTEAASPVAPSTGTHTTADNPFAAHSGPVLDEFVNGSHGPGPWTTGPGGQVWGTMADAQAEKKFRADKKNAARKTSSATKVPKAETPAPSAPSYHSAEASAATQAAEAATAKATSSGLPQDHAAAAVAHHHAASLNEAAGNADATAKHQDAETQHKSLAPSGVSAPAAPAASAPAAPSPSAPAGGIDYKKVQEEAMRLRMALQRGKAAKGPTAAQSATKSAKAAEDNIRALGVDPAKVRTSNYSSSKLFKGEYDLPKGAGPSSGEAGQLATQTQLPAEQIKSQLGDAVSSARDGGNSDISSPADIVDLVNYRRDSVMQDLADPNTKYVTLKGDYEFPITKELAQAILDGRVSPNGTVTASVTASALRRRVRG